MKTDLLPMKIESLNNVNLLRALTTNKRLGTLHHLPLQLLLAIKVNPTLSAVKVPPEIILAISSKNRVIFGIRNLTPHFWHGK